MAARRLRGALQIGARQRLRAAAAPPGRHTALCGLRLSRLGRPASGAEWEPRTQPSRSFLNLTNKRKEYSERRIIGRCTTSSPMWRTTRTSCPGARSRWWSPSGRATSRPSWRWASHLWWNATPPSSPSSAPTLSRPSARTGASSITWRRTGASAPASPATPAPAPWISRSPSSSAPCCTPSWPPSSSMRWSSRWWQPSSAEQPRTSVPRPASPGSSCSTRSTRREGGPAAVDCARAPGPPALRPPF